MNGTATTGIPVRPVHRDFPGAAHQVPLARDFVRRHLPHTCPFEAADEIALCVSEVTTNAIRHTRSCRDGFAVVIRVAAPTVRVEVFDSGPADDPPGRVDDLDEGGRGLLLVHAYAHRVGYEVTAHGGGLTWFEYAWTDGEAAS